MPKMHAMIKRKLIYVFQEVEVLHVDFLHWIGFGIQDADIYEYLIYYKD